MMLLEGKLYLNSTNYTYFNADRNIKKKVKWERK